MLKLLRKPPINYETSELLKGQFTLHSQRVTLRPKRPEDLENDYQWRSDPELCELDAALPLHATLKEFAIYHREDLQHPPPWSIKMAIEDAKGTHIGNSTIYNIDLPKGTAEFGIMIGRRECWDHGYGREAGTLFIDHIYNHSKLERIYLHTLTSNHRAQQCFAAIGFKQEKEVSRNGFRLLRMSFNRTAWIARTAA